MKRILIPATLLAMLSLTTVSCQKENIVETATNSVENSATRTIRYTVNGTAYRQVIRSDEDLDALMHTLFAFAACNPAGNECKTTSADTAERMETIAIIDTIIANNTQP